eukprot:gene8366-9220_t
MASQAQAHLSSISLAVPQVDSYLTFYEQVLEKVWTDGKIHLLPGRLSIDPVPWQPTPLEDEYNAGMGYSGIGLSLPSAAPLIDTALSLKASIARPLDDYSVGASLIPDEDEMKQIPVRYSHLLDPNGFGIEVTEEAPLDNPYVKVILKVLDLDKSIAFYTDVIGLTMFRKRSNVNNRPREASFMALVVRLDRPPPATVTI